MLFFVCGRGRGRGCGRLAGRGRGRGRDWLAGRGCGRGWPWPAGRKHKKAIVAEREKEREGFGHLLVGKVTGVPVVRGECSRNPGEFLHTSWDVVFCSGCFLFGGRFVSHGVGPLHACWFHAKSFQTLVSKPSWSISL